jgi:hypothetical protein
LEYGGLTPLWFKVEIRMILLIDLCGSPEAASGRRTPSRFSAARESLWQKRGTVKAGRQKRRRRPGAHKL